MPTRSGVHCRPQAHASTADNRNVPRLLRWPFQLIQKFLTQSFILTADLHIDGYYSRSASQAAQLCQSPTHATRLCHERTRSG